MLASVTEVPAADVLTRVRLTEQGYVITAPARGDRAVAPGLEQRAKRAPFRQVD